MQIGQSRDIFAQVAEVDGSAGVRVIIETHDACLHAPEATLGVTAATRLSIERMSRPVGVAERIGLQRERLSPLVTALRGRAVQAG